MAAYLILGAGKFGRLALKRLSAIDRKAAFLVVDRAPEALAAVRASFGLGVRCMAGEAIDFLAAHLGEGAPWHWIIPMAPLHVAFFWLRAGVLAGNGWEAVAVPDTLLHLAPGAGRAPMGGLYLSRARRWCPDDCEEPGGVCPVSGESREVPLHQELAALVVPGFQVRVVPTRQLAPGVGGYTPRQLLDLARDLATVRENVLIATACRCHGVVHGLGRRQGGEGV